MATTTAKPKEEHICVSKSNTKMGSIPSISFTPFATCSARMPCRKKCYAIKIMKLRKTVAASYERNWRIYKTDPDKFWRELEGAIMTSATFRWFVAGDIPDADFVVKMMDIMKRNPHCEAFAFTKKYRLINEYIAGGGKIPKNLHLMFSGWTGLPMDNPNKIPECHVLFKDGSTTAKDGAKLCTGNCTECFIEKKLCFALKKGEQVVIREH